MKRPAKKKKPVHASVPAFDLSINAVTGKQYVSYLKKYLLKALPIIKHAPTEISLAIVNDELMARLHKEYMDIDGTTDVLTFELDFDEDNRVTSGEIVICLPEARRRATELKHKIEQELLLYALHGVLHLVGYDDRTDAAYRTMHRMEDRILKSIGVGQIFARAAAKYKKVSKKK